MNFSDYMKLEQVNSEINLLPYKADPPDDDNWDPIDSSGGDCDSYAMAKLRRLLELGWPIERLRLACVYVEPPSRGYHAVLVVRTDDGERVLDNRQNHPCSLDELERIGYTPDRIQESGGSRQWVQWQWVKEGEA